MSIDQFLRHVFFNLVCKHISPIKQDTCILMNISLETQVGVRVRHMIQFPYPLLPTDLFMLHESCFGTIFKETGWSQDVVFYPCFYFSEGDLAVEIAVGRD